jgi:glutathionylspermidine synthase
MRRVPTEPRPDYRSRIEEVCLAWHDKDDYWNERCYYEFTRSQISDLEHVTNELQARCLDAVQFVIDQKRYGQLGIPDHAIPVIEQSWNEEWPSVYGRFDLAYDGIRPPRLLEYNADTPTALLEASVVQWYWLQDVFPSHDQFNSIHERLVAKWKELMPFLRGNAVHFCSVDDVEDGVTVTYMADTAVQAGLETRTMPVEEIGWDPESGTFVDPEDAPIRNIFKLYPWEYMFEEEFFEHVLRSGNQTFWIEPPWKAILSSKGILPVLHELFPFHPNLLPSYREGPRNLERFVQKPLYSREGEDVTILRRGDPVDPEFHIFQEYAPIPEFEGRTPVIGSWVIGEEAAGIGIRESSGPITDNLSHFIPHRVLI